MVKTGKKAVGITLPPKYLLPEGKSYLRLVITTRKKEGKKRASKPN